MWTRSSGLQLTLGRALASLPSPSSAPSRFALALALTLVSGLACSGIDARGSSSHELSDPAEAGAPPAPPPSQDIGLPALSDPPAYQEAPAIQGEWVRGSAVDLATDPRLIVLEHWATWCQPCVTQFPHLTKLQAENPDRIRVIAVSDEPVRPVRRFVAAHDPVMSYDVIADGAQTKSAYQALDGVESIPHAFIIHDQRVLWMGHPAALDEVLDMVVDGSWTPQLADASRQLPKLLEGYLGHIRADRREQLTELAGAFEEPLVDAGTQARIAWSLLSDSPDPIANSELALKLAERAVARTQRSDWGILATLALALRADGQLEPASATRQEAMALCRMSEAVKDCKKFERTLEQLFELL